MKHWVNPPVEGKSLNSINDPSGPAPDIEPIMPGKMYGAPFNQEP